MSENTSTDRTLAEDLKRFHAWLTDDGAYPVREAVKDLAGFAVALVGVEMLIVAAHILAE